ncbi:kainate-selective ionotropic glutamate receptor-like protein, partial [Euroglyphus maynei]
MLHPYPSLSIIILIVRIILLRNVQSLPHIIPVGAIFSSNELEEQQAFHMAIERFSTNLGRNNSRFEPIIKIVDVENSFLVYHDVCQLLQRSPVAIFGPFNDYGAQQLQSICEHYEIPHLEARMLVDFGSRTDLSINMYPHHSILSKVFSDLIETLDWRTFVIVYEDSESIIHFSQYLKQALEKNWELRIFQLQPDQPYREILWQVKQTQIVHIVLDVKTEHIVEVMKQAQQVGILSEQHKYLITSLDLHTLDLEDFRHSRTNITSLRIVQEQHPNLENWSKYPSIAKNNLGHGFNANVGHVK